MNADPYFFYILAAYLVGFSAILVMIAATLVDYRNLRRALERLAARTGRSIED